MKICFISSYPPEKEGVGLFTKRLVDNLKSEMVKTSVITFDYHVAYDTDKIVGYLGSSPLKIKSMYKYLDNLRPDIIHIQYATPVYRFYSPFLWMIISAYRKSHQVKIITTFHEVGKETQLLGKPGQIYYSFISSLSDQIIVHTTEAKKTLIAKCHVAENKINLIPLGIHNVNLEKSPTKSLNNLNNVLLNNKKVFLFFGYIHPDKGIDTLIEALHLLYQKHPETKQNTVLLIAGDVRPRKGLFKIFAFFDYAYKRKLKKLVSNYHLEPNIKFLGYIGDRDVFPLIHRSNFLVMPYKRVEQSGVLNIALQTNLPVIASDIGGLKELLGSTGLTVKPENPIELEKKMYSLLDPSYKKDITKLYQKIRLENSLSKVVTSHLSLYQKSLI